MAMNDGVISAALRAMGAGATRRSGLTGALGVLLGGAAVDAAAAGSRGSSRRRGAGGIEPGPTNRPGGAGPCGDGSGRDNA
ncbi:MAG: hypothetical protein ACKOWF_11730 [Chloroflexota bacterium]